jgi:hypothetical protein
MYEIYVQTDDQALLCIYEYCQNTEAVLQWVLSLCLLRIAVRMGVMSNTKESYNWFLSYI